MMDTVIALPLKRDQRKSHRQTTAHLPLISLSRPMTAQHRH